MWYAWGYLGNILHVVHNYVSLKDNAYIVQTKVLVNLIQRKKVIRENIDMQRIMEGHYTENHEMWQSHSIKFWM